MERQFKAVWANKQNRHDKMLPQLWWDIKLHNIDPHPTPWIRKSEPSTTVITHHTVLLQLWADIKYLKNFEIYKIFKRVRFY